MKSIFTKLILAYAALVLVVVAIVGGAAGLFVRQVLIGNRIDSLLAFGREIATISAPVLQNPAATGEVAVTLQALNRFMDVAVWVVDSNGQPILSPDRPVTTNLELTTGWLNRLREGTELSELTKGSPFGIEPTVVVGVPISAPGQGVVGAVLLYDSLHGIYQTGTQLRTLLLLALGSAGLLSILAATLLSRAISVPLRAMTEAALAMARGDFSHRVTVRSRDEVNHLAVAFNHLSVQLDSTIRALADEKAKMAEMVASMGEGVVAIDHIGSVITCNPAAEILLGQKAAELVGFSLAESKIGQELMSCFSTAAQTKLGDRSFKVQTSAGRVLHLSVSTIISHGRSVGQVALMADVTDVERLEQRQSDFVANAAHELRTPLTAVRGFLQPLMDGTVSDQPTQDRYLHVIFTETLRLIDLVNDLLDLTQLESATFSLETEPSDLADLLLTAAERLSPVAAERGVKLTTQLPGDLPIVPVDAARIDQVITNLLSNAIRFSPVGGVVHVSMRVTDGVFCLRVTDQGPGVPAEDAPFVWDRFYKSDKARSGRHNAGLGLAIARQIIERHGGGCVLDPNPEGSGSVFGFDLPMTHPTSRVIP